MTKKSLTWPSFVKAAKFLGIPLAVIASVLALGLFDVGNQADQESDRRHKVSEAVEYAAGCLKVSNPEGSVTVDNPVNFTVEISDIECSLFSALSGEAMSLNEVRTGRLIEMKLTSRHELLIQERTSMRKPLTQQRSVKWQWEIRPKEVKIYDLSLVVTILDADTEKIVDESDPIHFHFEAESSIWYDIKSLWGFLGNSLPAAIGGLVAVAGAVAASWAVMRGRKATEFSETAESPLELNSGASDTNRVSEELNVSPAIGTVGYETSGLPSRPRQELWLDEDQSIPFRVSVSGPGLDAFAQGTLNWKREPQIFAAEVSGHLVECNWHSPEDVGHAQVELVAMSKQAVADKKVRALTSGDESVGFNLTLNVDRDFGDELTEVKIRVCLFEGSISGDYSSYRPDSR